MAYKLYERKTRPNIQRCIHLPVIVKTAGHYILPPKNYDEGTIDDTIRIFWFLKGQGIMKVGNRVQQVGAGQVAFYEPFAHFYVEARGGDLEYYWTSMLGKLIMPIAESFGIKESGLYRTGEIPSALINKIHYHLDDTKPWRLIESSQRSYQLLSLIRPLKESKTEDDITNKTLQLINNHWQDKDFSINTIAEQLDIHRTSLNRHFQETVGNSPGKYLIRFRLQEAVRQLKETDKPISAIAYNVGYSDPHYFSRHFKKEIGCTPGEFRRQNINVPWE